MLGIVGEYLGEYRSHDGDRCEGEAEGRFEHAPDQRIRDRIGDVLIGDRDEGFQANDTDDKYAISRCYVSSRMIKCLAPEV